MSSECSRATRSLAHCYVQHLSPARGRGVRDEDSANGRRGHFGAVNLQADSNAVGERSRLLMESIIIQKHNLD